MIVIGIDPAPVKDTILFDGKVFHPIPANKLRDYLSELKKKHQNLLLCWDAPLTSFSDTYLQKSKDDKNKIDDSNFYTRKIEHIIKYEMKHKPHAGISTMPYASCPHWVITQHCLGLPQLFDEYRTVSRPFALITQNCPPLSGCHVIEVHPALALWGWLKSDTKTVSWKYKDKKDKKDFTRIREDIQIKLKAFDLLGNLDSIFKKIEDDDHLDAFIAWTLGVLWLKTNEVMLVGNRKSGAILLPQTQWSKELNDKIFAIDSEAKDHSFV